MGESSQSNTPAECILVVDSGYTQTTVTPVLYGRPVHSAIRRLDLGGKQLTNYLKELISLRHFSIMDEPHLASQIKEDACFVSHEFKLDLDSTWKATAKHKSSASDATTDIIQEYVLPDYVNTHRGHLRPYDPARHTAAAKLARSEEIFALGNERFVVPELMFSPSDIGIAQAGLPEVVVQSLSTLPVGLWPGMLANVVVVGGNAKLPGFVQRLEDDLRALTPADCMLRVRYPEE
jgi:actin-related protein 6